MCNLVLLIKDAGIASCADGNTPYIVGGNTDQFISALQMKMNPDKCYLLINENSKKEIKITGNIIGNCKCDKLLGTKIDNKLSFKLHAEDFWKRASRKIHTLARTTPYSMDFPRQWKEFPRNCFFFQIPV